jgi:histidinol-phosphate aminotransferase
VSLSETASSPAAIPSAGADAVSPMTSLVMPVPESWKSLAPTASSTALPMAHAEVGLHALLQAVVPGVQGLQPYQPGKPVEALERERGIRHALKLASNENPLGPSPRALAALVRASTGLHRYPDGPGWALKEALAARHGVAMEQITLGNGSNELLELIARTWLAPGRAAVFSAHAFAVYALVTQATGATAQVSPARSATDAAQPYGHDLAAMAAAIDPHTQVVFIANPNNPTGTYLSAGELEDFLQRVPLDRLVVVDEAYAEYVERPDYPDTTQWITRFPNLLVTRTFSKIFGLAGLRLGYAVSSPAVADQLNRVRQPFNVNLLAQVAGLAALDDTPHQADSVALNREGLAFLMAEFQARQMPFIPSVGNFLSVDCGRPAGWLYEALLREGVIVRPIANYGLPQHLRVTVSTPEENRRFLATLDRVRPA